MNAYVAFKYTAIAACISAFHLTGHAQSNTKIQLPVPVEIVAPKPVPVSGSVSVNGTSDVRVTNSTPIPVVGQLVPSGVQQVEITNSNPLSVQVVAGQVYKERIEMPWQEGGIDPTGTVSVSTQPLPEGFRVEIHSMMCTVFIPAPAASPIMIEMQGGSGNTRHFFNPEQRTLGQAHFASFEKKLLVHRRQTDVNNGTLTFRVWRQTNGAQVFIPPECTLSGYYIAEN